MGTNDLHPSLIDTGPYSAIGGPLQRENSFLALRDKGCYDPSFSSTKPFLRVGGP